MKAAQRSVKFQAFALSLPSCYIAACVMATQDIKVVTLVDDKKISCKEAVFYVRSGRSSSKSRFAMAEST